jgi:hypothetical protein
MGRGTFDSKAWTSYAASSAATMSTKGVRGVYTRTAKEGLAAELDPREFQVRESRDSVEHPNSRALMIGIDVTGSMGILAETLAKKDLGVVAQNLYDKHVLPDVHVLCGAIGDAEAGDQAPCQMSQFEASYQPLTSQLEKIYVEGGGGGNQGESYTLFWLAAAAKTAIDCFEKRGQKGYLFTVGDEPPLETVTREQAKRVLGVDLQVGISSQDILTWVSRQYEVFHLIVAEGSYASTRPDRVRKDWNGLLGQRAIWLTDHKAMGEMIVSTIQLNEGADRDTVTHQWSGDTSLVVADGLRNLPAGRPGNQGGLVTL